jgi:hypothetical protein
MRPVGFRENLPADDPSSPIDLRMPIPAPGPHDLLVRIHAASVNPVDTKIRRFSPTEDGELRVLGFDAAGTVVAVGSEVSRFAAGADVLDAGVTNRPGSVRLRRPGEVSPLLQARRRLNPRALSCFGRLVSREPTA